MTPERYQALIRMFDNDPQLIDELLAGQQAALRGADKAHIAQFRAKFKAAAQRGSGNIFDDVSTWLVNGGRPCL